MLCISICVFLSEFFLAKFLNHTVTIDLVHNGRVEEQSVIHMKEL